MTSPPPGNADFEAIRAGLEAKQFFLLYQPIVSLRTGGCFGAEALIRWRQPQGNTVEPVEFIPHTDQTPLSGSITYWVIETVASELGEWLDQHPNAHVSINVPPEILGRGGLEYAANRSGLRTRIRQVILEITERGIPDQLGLMALKSIPVTGARLALDDVTLSGANLALLMRCPFDFVKLDGGLVAELAPDRPTAPWLLGLTGLLRSTPLQVIAEGVETEFQVEALRAAGVQFAQGHRFSKPRPAEEFRSYYAELSRS